MLRGLGMWRQLARQFLPRVVAAREQAQCSLAQVVAHRRLRHHYRRRRRDVDRGTDPGLDFLRQLRLALQILARIVLALADLVAVVGVPGTGLVDQFVLHAEFDDLALARRSFTVEDIEDGLAEWRGDLVLDDLDPRFVADDFVALLDAADAADVKPNRRVELERVATGRRFRTCLLYTSRCV